MRDDERLEFGSGFFREHEQDTWVERRILSSADSSQIPAGSAESSHWDDVRRIYRRICLLREQGKTAEAASLESSELSRSLAAARAASRNGTEEARVLAAEAERVSTACLLAEIVAPLLAECLRDELQFVATNTAAKADAPSTRTVSAVRPESAKERPATPPNITDLIDGMLSLETAAR
ncbi:MAG: hypothetical protein NVV63_14795 [Opitutus sp.]|nr:hypothetical protein [Opitutus sp.]